ncbi:sigma-70 family RNA polymerase sigma factor [Senegalia massiliensis]|uniref:sigma-70 family RNA polymerase sigma factor n=1 Tax=Senegalia massiliensis TaxID=1720316 RepID=UPI0013EF099E|nr:sigma-70 family RNA polymerase sigma factor [Senegalia massiliensis]
MYSEIDNLVRKAKLGEKEAKMKLLESYKPLILTQIKKYYFEKEEMDDLINEGYEVILIGINKFDFSKGVYFSGYINTILRYHYLDKLKFKKYVVSLDKKISSKDSSISLIDTLESEIDIEKEYLYKELNNELVKNIEKLTIRQKQIIVMFYLQKINIKDISNRLGISYRTVVNTKKNALEKLKKLYSKK